jgi:hypothetical protein
MLIDAPPFPDIAPENMRLLARRGGMSFAQYCLEILLSSSRAALFQSCPSIVHLLAKLQNLTQISHHHHHQGHRQRGCLP